MKIIRHNPVPPAPKPDWPEIKRVIKRYPKYSSCQQEGFDHSYDICLRKNWYSWAHFHIDPEKFGDSYSEVIEYKIKCQEKDLACVIEFADYVEKETKAKVTVIYNDNKPWWAA